MVALKVEKTTIICQTRHIDIQIDKLTIHTPLSNNNIGICCCKIQINGLIVRSSTFKNKVGWLRRIFTLIIQVYNIPTIDGTSGIGNHRQIFIGS